MAIFHWNAQETCGMERFLVDPMEEVARGVEIGEEVRAPLKTTMSYTIPVQKKTKKCHRLVV